MLPWQFSIRTLLLLVALAAVCLTIHRVYQFWYVRYYPYHSLQTLVGTQVHNGDTFQEVARHFKKAEKVDFDNEPRVQMVWNSRGWAVLPGDEVWRFQHSARNGTVLQFREGRVVNFQSSDHADPDANARLNRAPVPPRLLRRGVWPFCVAIFIVGAGVLVVMDKKRRGVSRAE
jgi:hypothetical protein